MTAVLCIHLDHGLPMLPGVATTALTATVAFGLYNTTRYMKAYCALLVWVRQTTMLSRIWLEWHINLIMQAGASNGAGNSFSQLAACWPAPAVQIKCTHVADTITSRTSTDNITVRGDAQPQKAPHTPVLLQAA